MVQTKTILIMKNLYLITLMLTFVVVSTSIAQPLASPELSGPVKGQQFKGKNVIPIVGISVAVPLYRQYSRSRQLKKLSRLPLLQGDVLENQFAPANARVAAPTEDGPIAWEYTGEEATVYVQGSGGGGGYYGGGFYEGGWTNYGGSNCGGCAQDAPDGGGGGGGDTGETDLPRPLINARKVPKDYCQNGKNVFRNMWDRQSQVNKEQAALVTDKGIFWLDDAENTEGSCKIGQSWEYSGPTGSKFFMVNGEIYTITAIVHTHPTSSGPGVSGLDHDLGLSTAFGVPIYAISPDGIYRGLPNHGAQDVMSNNPQLAFDCMIANNLFGI